MTKEGFAMVADDLQQAIATTSFWMKCHPA